MSSQFSWEMHAFARELLREIILSLTPAPAPRRSILSISTFHPFSCENTSSFPAGCLLAHAPDEPLLVNAVIRTL